MYERQYGERKRLSPYFFAFFVLGAVLVILFREEMEIEGLISESNLYYLRRGDMDYRGFFTYILSKRFFMYAFMLCLVTGNRQRLFVRCILFFLGVGLGGFFGASIFVYGLTGIIFFLLMGFPQFFFYGAVIYLLCVYVAGQAGDRRRFVLQAMFLGVLILLGCFAESYVNPFFLSKFLRFF